MVLEIVAAVGGSIAFAKYLGPLLYHECFAPTSDDDLLLNAGLFPTDRSPLLTPSPRADSLRLATELYNGHVEDWLTRGSTPAATTDASGASTPASASPGSAASSYFDLRQPPLYINDVQVALERERRNSNEFVRANALAGFQMTPGGDADDGLTMIKKPSFVRRFSNQMGGKLVNKSFSEETAWLTSSLVCLLHSPDLSQFFLSGAYLDEDVDSKHHRNIIESFASAARFFWSASPSTSLDLSTFQAILKRSSPNPTAAPTPLSSSPSSPRMGPLALSSASSVATTLVEDGRTRMGGAAVVSNLLKALHVALNEGEWTSDQPTYLRSPYQLSSSTSSSSSLEEHVGFLRNVQSIQEDSVVRDVFEGLVCVRTACGSCGESVARFEGFSVLPLPAPLAPSNKKPTLAALLKAYERTRNQEKPQWCAQCAQWTFHEETRRVWSLPSTVIFQLPSTTTATHGVASASSSRTNSPYMKTRRLSRSGSISSSGLAGFTPLTPPQVAVEYPVEGLDLSKFSGEKRHHASSTSSSSAPSQCDLSSDSEEEGEAVYDLFAVRESGFKVLARDPVAGKWAAFDAATGAGREVKDLKEVVTPNADLLFYRRRE